MSAWWQLLRQVVLFPASLLYPPLCRGCQCYVTEGLLFCDNCSKKVRPLVSLDIPITPTYTMTLFAAARYMQPVKGLVLRKFAGDVLASKQLAQLILQQTPIKNLHIDYIVPIPLHWRRYAHRGFNQAQVMAQALGRELHVPVLDLLRRTRATGYQSRLSLVEREENVRGIFALKSRYATTIRSCVQGKTILFVDDLSTTGATLANAAKVITRYRPAQVLGVVAAR